MQTKDSELESSSARRTTRGRTREAQSASHHKTSVCRRCRFLVQVLQAGDNKTALPQAVTGGLVRGRGRRFSTAIGRPEKGSVLLLPRGRISPGTGQRVSHCSPEVDTTAATLIPGHCG